MRAAGGRVLLGDRRPGDPPLPDDLQHALGEWAAFAGEGRAAGPDEQDLIRRRGRQLAGRVALVRGRPVDFVDPLSGSVESVGVPGAEPAPAGTVPWVAGVPVAAFFGVLVAMADVVVSRAFAEVFGWLWVPANLLVVLGLAPSLILLRRVPFWRWPAFGATAGLLVAWLVLLVGLLG